MSTQSHIIPQGRKLCLIANSDSLNSLNSNVLEVTVWQFAFPF